MLENLEKIKNFLLKNRSFLFTRLTAFCLSLFLIYGMAYSYSWIEDVNIQTQFINPLKFAVSDTDPARMAKTFHKILDYLHKEGLDKRNVCTWLYSEVCDSALFYNKLEDSYQDLMALEDSDPLTISNILIKTRESFIDDSPNSETLDFPSNIPIAIKWKVLKAYYLWENYTFLTASTLVTLLGSICFSNRWKERQS